MSQLLEIRKQIETAAQRILSLERAMRDHPNLPSVAANLETAVRLHSKLEQQFSEAAQRAGYDLCRYRAFDDDDDMPVVGASLAAIADFEKLISVVYAALKHGKKQRGTVPQDVSKEMGIGFGYSFAGSIGVVLTVRNEKMLLDDSLLDESLNTVFSLAEAKTSEDVLKFSEKLGPGPINTLYEWANDNAIHGLGAEIDWQKGPVVKRNILVQRQELSRLRTTIEQTSSEKTKTITVVGTLTMADVTKNKFRLRREGLPEMRGSVAPRVITEKHAVELPKVYSATVEKRVRIIFSTGSENVSYKLLKLTEP